LNAGGDVTMARNDIQPDLQNINEYFSRKEFFIPSYQRPYAWQLPQCEQLIEDIETHQDSFDPSSQDNYFFGAILIAQESGEKHDVTLIDGQQRTTTFMLLLKAILLKINDELSKLNEDSLEDAKLVENFKTIHDVLVKAKPAAAKGIYMKNITVTTTFGPGVHIENKRIIAIQIIIRILNIFTFTAKI